MIITEWIKETLRPYIQKGDFWIDATAGKGNDTLFLCERVGHAGRVLAFDIQEQAIAAVKEVLKKNEFENIAEVYFDGHENMLRYVKTCTVDGILFNLGYLPGGDHKIATHYDTTIKALEAGLSALKPGGRISLCIYSGKDSGFEEKEKVLAWMKGLDSREYTVIVSEFFNKPNHPPLPVTIIKQNKKKNL